MDEDRQRDEDYATLYERMFHEMTKTARSLLRRHQLPTSVADAEDIVQEAFMKALPHLEVQNKKAYVYKIIQRDVARISSRFVPTEPLTDSREPVSGEPELSDLVAIRATLHELSPRQRAAVWMKYALGYTRGEVSQLLGCTSGTVARHVSRGSAGALLALTIAILIAFAVWAMMSSLPGDPFEYMHSLEDKMSW